MRQRIPPPWLSNTDCWYYSHIQWGPNYVVTVARAAGDQEVSEERPGTLLLQVQPRFGTTQVFDADGREQGDIRSEGILPGLRFVMRRNRAVVWIATVRSFVRKRHHLKMGHADLWTIDTPFFWWQHLTGTVNGHERLVGLVGPSKRWWGFAIEPGLETLDLLAALAFIHWKWWRW